jgi:hypothetical protein
MLLARVEGDIYKVWVAESDGRKIIQVLQMHNELGERSEITRLVVHKSRGSEGGVGEGVYKRWRVWEDILKLDRRLIHSRLHLIGRTNTSAERDPCIARAQGIGLC